MSTKRQREAMARFMGTVEACKADMHPEDVVFEPKNFDNWMGSCDRGNIASVKAYCDCLKPALASAKDSNPSGVYVQIRTHFLAYAEAAMLRRFPEPKAGPPAPERTTRFQCNYCGAFVSLFHLPGHDCKYRN